MDRDPPTALKLRAEVERLRARLAELETAQALDGRGQGEPGREFSQTVLNSLRDAVYMVDARDFCIVECNQIFLQQMGLDRQQVIGCPCYQISHQRPEPCQGMAEDCHALHTFRSGQPSLSEHILLDADGSRRHIECTTLPVMGPGGKVERIVHLHRDITKRKQAWEKFQEANRELHRSNAFLRNLIMSSVDAVIAADMTGRILIFNEAAGQITGYSEQEALQQIDIRRIYPGDGARQVMAMLRSDQHGGKGKLKSHEVQLLRKDGTLVPISLSAAVVMEGDNEVGTVGFFYDLREKRRMEAELDRTRVQLLQAEKMASIGKLAAGVAHQLNNPLAGITLYANILAEDYALPDEARQDLQRILDNAQRSRDTIKELLQFARQTRQEIRPANLNEALSRTLFLLENQSLFQNIQIVRDLAPDLPLLPADIQQLNHVFMNIILNAAEAMEAQGRIEVRSRLAPDGRWVEVEIADNGPGVPAQALPHIFEPFFTTKDEGKGTGLGLSVAFGIIENHHGRITALSPPGQGARFVIQLPLSNGAEGKA
ncbi:MAG: PAS domain S-box protein [Desulfarculus sp.]|jgi:PAS domain S-box-containing protein|nr:MAG: PAS domain S-box protein [Desulfarculus sp.]